MSSIRHWGFVLAAVFAYGCGGGGGGGGGPGPTVACTTSVSIAPTSTTSGALQSGDCALASLFAPASGDSSLADRYVVSLPTAGRLDISLASAEFDAFLILLRGDGQPPEIATDDDGGGGSNALISAQLDAGTYIILVNSATTLAVTGAYSLSTSFPPWSATSSIMAPDARTGHTAVWTGTEMIVWGGDDGNAIAKNTGARFNPSSNTWAPISTVGAPSARIFHSAVWTGTEMIIWGGFSAAPTFQMLADGARYNAQTDTWTALATSASASARAGHTAIWTGSAMIVWGGFACFACTGGQLASGAAYDPSTDGWTATSAIAAPAGRGSHTAVWTGSRMIVWGGEDDAAVLESGGIYDPAANSWTGTSTTSAPAARRCHSAVWTGSEMLVQGGQLNRSLACGQSSDASGGRYDPSANLWTAMSASPVSSTLANLPAVWSGTQLIAWGDGGARYNPATNTWNGISSQGAPTSRRFHSIVWTGSQVIVWGGSFAGPLGDGGIYMPSIDPTP